MIYGHLLYTYQEKKIVAGCYFRTSHCSEKETERCLDNNLSKIICKYLGETEIDIMSTKLNRKIHKYALLL